MLPAINKDRKISTAYATVSQAIKASKKTMKKEWGKEAQYFILLAALLKSNFHLTWIL